MFYAELQESNDYWNLTVGDVYEVIFDGYYSEYYIKDDLCTRLDLEEVDSKTFYLAADREVVFSTDFDF